MDLGPGTSPNRNNEPKSGGDGMHRLTEISKIVQTLGLQMIFLSVCFLVTSAAPFPESPRLSRFPNLPDMSPKKVSATHNVYVSPLRSSKVN